MSELDDGIPREYLVWNRKNVVKISEGLVYSSFIRLTELSLNSDKHLLWLHWKLLPPIQNNLAIQFLSQVIRHIILSCPAMIYYFNI